MVLLMELNLLCMSQRLHKVHLVQMTLKMTLADWATQIGKTLSMTINSKYDLGVNVAIASPCQLLECCCCLDISQVVTKMRGLVKPGSGGARAREMAW